MKMEQEEEEKKAAWVMLYVYGNVTRNHLTLCNYYELIKM
jgi:hypothetical protein